MLGDLIAGREAIESGLARNPSELFADPPPFPVPILDGVLQSWRDASEREQQHALVLQDRRTNLKRAREVIEDLENQRRQVRDLQKRNSEALEDIRLAAMAITMAIRIVTAEPAVADPRTQATRLQQPARG